MTNEANGDVASEDGLLDAIEALCDDEQNVVMPNKLMTVLVLMRKPIIQHAIQKEFNVSNDAYKQLITNLYKEIKKCSNLKHEQDILSYSSVDNTDDDSDDLKGFIDRSRRFALAETKSDALSTFVQADLLKTFKNTGEPTTWLDVLESCLESTGDQYLGSKALKAGGIDLYKLFPHRDPVKALVDKVIQALNTPTPQLKTNIIAGFAGAPNLKQAS